VIVEPWAKRRHVTATGRRTTPDFAGRRQHLCDAMYPQADLIRVVLDNLNTHAYGSLFATDPPHEALRLARRPGFSFTPKRAGRLAPAGRELSLLARHCLDRRPSSRRAVVAEVAPWEEGRNRAGVGLR